MKIGIIGAMEEEIAQLKSKLSNIKTHEIANQYLITGDFENHEIIILQCGIGKVNASLGTTLLINLYKPDCVINTGVAGGVSSGLNVGDIVISSEVRYHDVDLTNFGYEYGQMARMPACYLPSLYLISIVEKCLRNITGQKLIKGLIVSGDSFINRSEQTNYIRSKFSDVCAVDMEACAIAQVCYLFKTPFIIIRSISDTPDNGNSTISYEQFLALAANKSAQLVLAMVKEMRQGSRQSNNI